MLKFGLLSEMKKRVVEPSAPRGAVGTIFQWRKLVCAPNSCSDLLFLVNLRSPLLTRRSSHSNSPDSLGGRSSGEREHGFYKVRQSEDFFF